MLHPSHRFLWIFTGDFPNDPAQISLSLAIGRVASRRGIPRVTVYLLVGLALGPQLGLALVGADTAASRFLLGSQTEATLRVLQELGVGFILFGIGAAFRFSTFREVGPRVLTVSAAEIGLTSLLVGGCVYAATGDWRLGVIAFAVCLMAR